MSPVFTFIATTFVSISTHADTEEICRVLSAVTAVNGSFQWHRNAQINNIDNLTANGILAFAERLLLAKSSRQRAPSITTGLHPKTDMRAAMSAIGGKADIKSRAANVRT